MSDKDGRAVHQALGGFLHEGELAIAWTLTIDVAGPDEVRYLAHCSGGGIDGTEAPTDWAALGMLRSSVLNAEQEIDGLTREVDDDQDDELDE